MAAPTTSIKPHEGLSEYFDQNKLLPRFLVNDHMELEKIVIDADFSCSEYQTKGNPTCNALDLSLNKDRYARVIGLLEAASARLTNEHEHGRSMGKHTMLKSFMSRFLTRLAPGKGQHDAT